MKKIIATIIVLVMLLCCFSLPCMADIASDGYLLVKYTVESGTVNLSGVIPASMGKNWATYYMLNPGKTRDDIPNHTADDPVFSSYGEITADDDGSFNYEFKHTGKPGVYTLYFTTGYAQLTREIDTTKDVLLESGRLEALKNLPTSYDAPTSTSVKELFAEKVGEIPSEMPVVKNAEIKGYTEIYVDVENGDDDEADGTINNPYKTINQALKDFPAHAGMVLYLREGEYPARDGLVLSKIIAADEIPFIVSNYGNEKVTVAGGTPIKSDDFEKVTDGEIIQRLDPAVIDDILVVDLKEKYGITDYGEISTDGAAPILFVGNTKYTIARWPNSETTSMREYEGTDGEAGVVDSGMVTEAASYCNGGVKRPYSKWYTELLASGKTPTEEETAMATGIEFSVEDLRPFSWVDTGDIWVYGKFYGDWTLNHLNIAQFNPEKRSIRTKTGLGWGCCYNEGNTFYYYNVLEELDAPGEWFVDKQTGKLYIYPTGDLSNTKIVYAPSFTYATWHLQNCKNVVINGINFEKINGRAMNISGADTDSVVVQNCSFEDVVYGLNIAGKYSGVINSTFKNVEIDAVYMGANNDRKQLIPDRRFIQNCVFYNTGGISANGVGQIISHNYISNTRGTCINSAGNENIIEYNEIVAGPRNVTDAGAIYIGGVDAFRRGNHVRYNYIHSQPTGPRAIYFDDMLSECYAYGNIIDGSWMHVHTGSENTIYNNIFMNYTSSNRQGPIRITNNYWTHSNNGAPDWKSAALEYGLFTANLLASAGYGGNEKTNELTGPFAERYPRLKDWAKLMYQRLDEYEATEKTDKDAITSSIPAYKHVHYETDYFLGFIPIGEKKVETEIYLNQYLASARDNYVANNVMINTATNVLGLPDSDGKFRTTFSGYIGTVDKNNAYLTTEKNPFAGKSFSDETAYETIRASVPDFETIPFEKIGLMSEEDYPVNEETHSISPVDTTEVSISAKDLSLKWSAVEGAQKYTVEIASDADFNNVFESATTYDLSYKVETSLESNKTYYWRVKTETTAKCAKGEIEISEAFKFKTLIEGQSSERNQVGVTVYSVDDMSNDNFNVTTYAYNTTDKVMPATIHIACYGEDGRLISTKSETITVPNDGFTSKYVFNFTAPNTKKIKLFVWSADGKMTPYTFVKTL